MVGADRFTTTKKEFDLRPGGKWMHTRHGSDGTDYRNDIEFTPVVAPKLIEHDHGPSEVPHHGYLRRSRGRFNPAFNAGCVPDKDRNRSDVEKFGAIEGMNQTLSRLEEYLTKI